MSISLVSKGRKMCRSCVCLTTWITLTYYDWTHLIWNFGRCGYSQAFYVRSFAFNPPPHFWHFYLVFLNLHYTLSRTPLSFCIIFLNPFSTIVLFQPHFSVKHFFSLTTITLLNLLVSDNFRHLLPIVLPPLMSFLLCFIFPLNTPRLSAFLYPFSFLSLAFLITIYHP